MIFGTHEYYPTRGSLEPVRDALKEAAEVLDEEFSARWRFGVPPAAGGVAGGAAGIGVGKGVLAIGAVTGTKGAAALASGLAFAGAAVGGGMAAGIAVVAVPAVVLGAVGFMMVKRKQQSRLREEKVELLGEAVRQQEAIKLNKHQWLGGDSQLLDHVRMIEVRLADVIKHLRHDLKA